MNADRQAEMPVKGTFAEHEGKTNLTRQYGGIPAVAG
jgi:hypothetical protein